MKEIQRWFLWLAIIGPIHLGEQLLFGLDELQILKRGFAGFYGLFSDPDYATVTLVIVFGTIVNLIGYAFVLGGKWRFAALAFFALVGVGEIHHVISTAERGSYFPGTVTAIPYFIFGVLLTRALIFEYRRIYSPVSAAALARTS